MSKPDWATAMSMEEWAEQCARQLDKAEAVIKDRDARIRELEDIIEKVRLCCYRKMRYTDHFSEAELLCDDILDIVGKKEVGDE